MCMFLFILCCLLESYPLDIIIILCVHLIVDLFLQSFSFLICEWSVLCIRISVTILYIKWHKQFNIFLEEVIKNCRKKWKPSPVHISLLRYWWWLQFLLSLGYRNKINNWLLCFNCTQNEKLLQLKINSHK